MSILHPALLLPIFTYFSLPNLQMVVEEVVVELCNKK